MSQLPALRQPDAREEDGEDSVRQLLAAKDAEIRGKGQALEAAQEALHAAQAALAASTAAFTLKKCVCYEGLGFQVLGFGLMRRQAANVASTAAWTLKKCVRCRIQGQGLGLALTLSPEVGLGFCRHGAPSPAGHHTPGSPCPSSYPGVYVGTLSNREPSRGMQAVLPAEPAFHITGWVTKQAFMTSNCSDFSSVSFQRLACRNRRCSIS